MPYKDKEFRKKYQKEYYKKWVKDNPEYRKIYANMRYHDNPGKYNRWNKEYAIWGKEFKLSLGCAICGYNKCSSALVFHHVFSVLKRKKQGSLNVKYLYTGNKEHWDEFYKCILLCENCHREIHESVR